MSLRVVERSRQPAATPMQQPLVWGSPARTPVRRLHGALVFIIAAALISAVGMLYLLQTSHVANLGYEMSRLQEERTSALVEQQQLAAQIAEKQALTSVETRARQDLGMRSIDRYVFLDVDIPAKETASPATVDRSAPSTLERFWNRLTGDSSGVDNQDEGSPDD